MEIHTVKRVTQRSMLVNKPSGLQMVKSFYASRGRIKCTALIQPQDKRYTSSCSGWQVSPSKMSCFTIIMNQVNLQECFLETKLIPINTGFSITRTSKFKIKRLAKINICKK